MDDLSRIYLIRAFCGENNFSSFLINIIFSSDSVIIFYCESLTMFNCESFFIVYGENFISVHCEGYIIFSCRGFIILYCESFAGCCLDFNLNVYFDVLFVFLSQGVTAFTNTGDPISNATIVVQVLDFDFIF